MLFNRLVWFIAFAILDRLASWMFQFSFQNLSDCKFSVKRKQIFWNNSKVAFYMQVRYTGYGFFLKEKILQLFPVLKFCNVHLTKLTININPFSASFVSILKYVEKINFWQLYQSMFVFLCYCEMLFKCCILNAFIKLWNAIEIFMLFMKHCKTLLPLLDLICSIKALSIRILWLCWLGQTRSLGVKHFQSGCFGCADLVRLDM